MTVYSKLKSWRYRKRLETVALDFLRILHLWTEFILEQVKDLTVSDITDETEIS